MRVRVLRLVASAFGVFTPGVVVDVPARIGREWCEVGTAMKDKSLDGGNETKAEPKKIIRKRKTRR